MARLGGEQPVVAELLELAGRGPMSLSDGAMTPVSTFMAESPPSTPVSIGRPAATTVAVGGTPRRYRRCMTAEVIVDPRRGARSSRAGVAVAELDGHVHELPAGVPVRLHRAAARAAVGAGEQGHARAPRAAAPHVAPARRAHARRRARRPRPRRGRARGRSRVRGARAHPEEASSSTPTPRCSCARYFEIEDPRDVTRARRRAARQPPSSSGRHDPRHHRPARARRRRRARRHRLQDRARRRARAGSRRAWPACTSTRCCASGCSAAARRACSCSTCRSPSAIITAPVRPSRCAASR